MTLRRRDGSAAVPDEKFMFNYAFTSAHAQRYRSGFAWLTPQNRAATGSTALCPNGAPAVVWGAVRLLSVSTLLACLLLCMAATTAHGQSCALYPSPHQRIGYNVTREGGVGIEDYDTASLGAGWYHDYTFRQFPSRPANIQYHQMVRIHAVRDIANLAQQLGPSIDANPNALWILGNEPDRVGQDNLTPTEYATFYHDLYHFIKARDPSSRIAIAGLVQPTPLRLRYLEMVLSAYQKRYGETMPVEVWDLHNFIMPENCEWGAGIPPGLEAYRNEGIACPASFHDHGNIEIFKAQIRTFRQWMADQGYRDRPLIISEYGILLSKYHGYDHARVRAFMLATFDFMLTATDPELGYSLDDNHLVQEFAWFSLNYLEFDPITLVGLNGNLFDHATRQITPLGLDYAAYVKQITETGIDLAIDRLEVTPAQIDLHSPISFTTNFVNGGSLPATDVSVRFWNGNPFGGGTLLGVTPMLPTVRAKCLPSQQATFHWTPPEAGTYTIFAELHAANLDSDSNLANNYQYLTFSVPSTTTPSTPTPTPTPNPQPNLSLSITIDPANPTPGSDLIYTIHYTNTGQTPIEGLQLNLTLPNHTHIQPSRSTPGWICAQIAQTDLCQLAVGKVDSGTSQAVLFAVTLDSVIPDIHTPITLTVNAQDRNHVIDLEKSVTVFVSHSERSDYYLPLIQQ